jgi:transcriptional regulator with XRE-family HTH domain
LWLFSQIDDKFATIRRFLMIDSDWFYRQLDGNGRSLRDMARVLGLDPSGVSRMLRGERKMSADEQDGIADYLGVSIVEVAARRRGESAGFGEQAQEALKMDTEGAGAVVQAGNGSDAEAATSVSLFDRLRSKMAGTVTIPPGVDVTKPADPEWARVYDDDYEYPLHL